MWASLVAVLMLGAPIRKEEEEAPPDLEKSRGRLFPSPSCVERNKNILETTRAFLRFYALVHFAAYRI